MSRRAVEWAYQQDCPSSGAKFTLVTLADYADEQHTCFPGQATLAAKTGQGVRSVRRQLDQLEEAGLISRARRHRGAGGGSGRTSDRYILHLPVDDASTGHDGRLNAGARETATEQPAEAPSAPSTGTDGSTGHGGRKNGSTGHPRQFHRPSTTVQPATVAGHELEVNRQGTTSGGGELTTDQLDEMSRAGQAGPAAAKPAMLVARFVNAAGERPPSAVCDAVARQVTALLADGIPGDDIAGALELLADKGLHHSLLPSLVTEHRANRRRAAPDVAALEDLTARRTAGARTRGQVLAEQRIDRAEAAELLDDEYGHDEQLLEVAIAAYDQTVEQEAHR